ncbi:MAG: 30S ribosomal protein S4 [Nitrospinae bacterium RIFCSPLOWO2_12_FULL_45_22]|uniref:Small ribosomal subunit protein uS4 n=1 Tax=uncultured bacterium Rifle_16ft_4_minimus_4226 TaxID=1665160 RepID=A0A0H4TCC2_9BACT|nr:30S ribosomal protein S4, small subunit ribosomal protein S4 [uncultured bacterium Rifle_16ft_4_minimus_4226]OGW14998.1 MAG: 30S ribosomal protein S4 [Nitrospinae bacterium RIFCSPLOWO2_12_FULL_45_22]
MARYRESVCRFCRREGMKLFLKGERCLADKCAIDRRNYPPGQHGQRRPKLSEYGLQLREKQKVKRYYGLLERQFKNSFYQAERQRGITGEELLSLLERRLDNVVYRAGLLPSRKLARQFVCQNHFMVNNKKVDIPSYLVKIGDIIRVKESSKENEYIKEAPRRADQRGIPEWLSLDKDRLEVIIQDKPNKGHIPININEQLIVGLYSK